MEMKAINGKRGFLRKIQAAIHDLSPYQCVKNNKTPIVSNKINGFCMAR